MFTATQAISDFQPSHLPLEPGKFYIFPSFPFDPLFFDRFSLTFVGNATYNNGTSYRWVYRLDEIADFAAASLQWDSMQGGLKLSYAISGGNLPTDLLGDVYSATGTTPGAVVGYATSLSLPNYNTGTFNQNIPGYFLYPPDETTHFVVTFNGGTTSIGSAFFCETNPNNNVVSVPDVAIQLGNSAPVSALTISTVKNVLRLAGDSSVTFSRTISTIEDQARIMYDVLAGPVTATMRKKGFSSTVDYSASLYRSTPEVIYAYVFGVDAGETASQIKADMADAIREVKAVRPTAFRHTSDPDQLQVVDIAPSTVNNHRRFNIALSQAFGISRVLSPYTNPTDIAFHLEIPQGGLRNQQFREAVVAARDSIRPRRSVLKTTASPPPGLTPATTVDVSTGAAFASGHVSTGHVVYSFNAAQGDLVNLGVAATSSSGEPDSVLYLFDEQGHLLAFNDDADAAASGFQSGIENFTASVSQTYFVVVATFGNTPTFNQSGMVTGWSDAGEADIDYDLLLARSSPPSFATIPDQVLPLSGVLNIALTVSDNETPQDALTFAVDWSNHGLIGDAWVETINGASVLHIYAFPGKVGISSITVTVSDLTGQQVTRTFTVEIPDTDADGIADNWEQANFGNLSTADAQSDHDGDGFSDHDEFVCQTDPKDPNSFLRISQISKSEGTVTLTFETVLDVQYSVFSSEDLVNWNAIGYIYGLGEEEQFVSVESPQLGRKFYRLGIYQPE